MLRAIQHAYIGAALLLVCAPAVGTDFVIGTVEDASGRPVPGAAVGSSYALGPTLAQTRVQIGYGQPPVVTDGKGTFKIPAAGISYTHVLVAATADGRLGYAAKQGSGPTAIRLGRPARLKIDAMKSFGARALISVELLAQGSAVGYATMRGGRGALVVPQGSFELGVFEPESVAFRKDIRLSAAESQVVRVQLRPTRWARNLGKPAPALTPTDVRNWPPGKSFDTLRGKWILVTFWATWCLPCLREMPALIEFYEKQALHRDRFEIVAVHAREGGASFAAIQSAYASLVQHWHKPIPFPLAFDSTGATQQRWGVEVYPSTFLVDPEGRLVGAATLGDLAAKLGT